MTEQEFEQILQAAAQQLTAEAQQTKFPSAKAFETRVGAVLDELVTPHGLRVSLDVRAYVFPDIAVGEFGVEVKFTGGDEWFSIANSVFETTRNPAVEHVYVVFGKMGGTPEVRWNTYEAAVNHVRTTHVPRFEVDMTNTESLFQTRFGVSYREFSLLSEQEKMRHVREYARQNLKPGEHRWWLGDDPDQQPALPINPRLYVNLTGAEKLKLRAEITLLFPRVVSHSRDRAKYEGVAMFLMTYHGVLASQTRDLFSAGSVGNPTNDDAGGLYVQRALEILQSDIRAAALRLDDALFVEYWGESVPPERRIARWLEKADEYARDWKPSDVLFKDDPGTA